MKQLFSILLFIGLSLTQKGSRLPPMGWNTWCTGDFLPCLDDYCSQSEIENVAFAMSTNGMKELGYNYILLDDCWAAKERTANGTMQADSTRFPTGTLEPLAKYVHSLGFKLGLYTDVGEHTCKYGRTGSWPHYKQDAHTWASWGIDYVKMDWCGHPGGFTAQELYTNMSIALNKTGREITLSLCEWGLYSPWEWAPKIGNLWRVGPDHLPLWWTPETSQDPGQGQGTANIIQHMAGKGKYVKEYAFNDPDFLELGFIWFSEEEQKTAFSFWCLWSSPLIIATDIRYLENKKEILNKEAIDINQDSLITGGDLRKNNSDGSQIWSRNLHDGSWGVILYNSNLEFGSVNINLVFEDLSLPGWKSEYKNATVRDLWEHRNLGVFQNQWSVSDLKPRHSRFVKVTPHS